MGLSHGSPGGDRQFEQAKLWDDALRQRRFEQQEAMRRSCPFRPTLSKETERISRRIRQDSAHSRRGGGETLSGNFPEAAERLYRDGGERLLRRQFTVHRTRSENAAFVIGGRRKLSRRGVSQLLHRLETWQLEREHHLAVRRREIEKARIQSAAAMRHRGRSPIDFEEMNSPLHEEAPRALSLESLNRLPSAAPRPRLPQGKTPQALPSVKSSLPYGSYDSDAKEDDGERSADSLDLTNSITVSMLSMSTNSATADDAGVKKRQIFYNEMRRIRIGALFYKYASPKAETVSIADVQEKVRLLYPEDVGITAALRTFIKSDNLALTKPQFMGALQRYEQHYGPQEWGRTEKDKILFPHLELASTRSLPPPSTRASLCKEIPHQGAPEGLPPPVPVVPRTSESGKQPSK
ncbi:unnamed protein product [Phytomonas sp. Hart1]|nr:unnamed protein product [Phytomonas sp. Hart1]|eukprot:CCW68920.1 unnamed protein product [Phytomonas sp. isolate Hart1]